MTNLGKIKVSKGLCFIVKALAVVAAVALIYYAVQTMIDKYDIWLEIAIASAFSVVGLCFLYILHALFHECGHLIGAKICGAIITAFSVSGFTTNYYDMVEKEKKKKISFNFSNVYAGYVSYISKSPETAEKTVKTALWGGIIASIIALIANIFILIFVKNFIIFTVFGVGGLSMWVIALINTVCLVPDSDGVIAVMKGQRLFDKVVSRIETEAYFYQGKSLTDMPENLFISDENPKRNVYYSYLRLLQQNKLNEASLLMQNQLNKNLCTGDEYRAFAVESGFILALDNDLETLEVIKEELLTNFENNYSPTSLRIMIAVAKARGDTEWANTLLNSFENMSSCLLNGLLTTEKQIVDNFCK